MSGSRSQQDQARARNGIDVILAHGQCSVVNRARKQSKKWAVGRSGLGRRWVRVRSNETVVKARVPDGFCRNQVTTARMKRWHESRGRSRSIEIPCSVYTLSLSLSLSMSLFVGDRTRKLFPRSRARCQTIQPICSKLGEISIYPAGTQQSTRLDICVPCQIYSEN